eukprot:gene15353-18212_t
MKSPILCLTIAALVLISLVATISATSLNDRTIIAHPKPPAYWKIERDAKPTDRIQFKILLKQKNLDKLEAYFWECSDPESQYYGEYLTNLQVNELVASEPESVDLVVKHLGDHGISESEYTVFSDYIAVDTSCSKSSQLFQTSFALYTNANSGRQRIRTVGPSSLPTDLLDHVDFVTGLSEFVEKPKVQGAHSINKNYVASSDNKLGDDILITPQVLKGYYNVPSSAVGTQSTNLQGIAAFSDFFSMGALAAFDKQYGITNVNVTRNGTDCLGMGCDQYESDLDVQYMTAMGEGIPTIFMAHQDGQWILDYAQGVLTMTNPPLVQSISYGWSELSQCDVTSGCSTFGYNSKQYVTRTDTELQKMGTIGITVLVSDGDDGAPSLGGASGNCPIDSGTYCPTGGCKHTKSMCPELTYVLNSNNSLCFYPMGVGSDACTPMLSDANLQKAVDAFSKANSKCNIAFETDRTNLPHVYSSCSCQDLKNATAAGYTVSAYEFNPSNGALFTSEYPCSSPFVTAVGATQFLARNGNITQELGCSILSGAKITTGGGFSTFQPQPSYQTKAVAAYLANNANSLPPSYSFSSNYRGYPDISFNGHNYNIQASTNQADMDQCPCSQLPVDGTSCSSPALAGLIALINDKLIGNGKTPLGFINPLLYQLAVQNPSAFNDITSGSNRCNRAYCCKYGFSAAEGWDAVSGLGSIDFQEFQKYILQIKGVSL